MSERFKMDELIAKIVSSVNAANGSLEWGAMLETLSYSERLMLNRAIAQARANGQLKRKLVFDPTAHKNVLTLEIPQNGGE